MIVEQLLLDYTIINLLLLADDLTLERSCTCRHNSVKTAATINDKFSRPKRFLEGLPSVHLTDCIQSATMRVSSAF